jgi:hypothetical protein
MPRYQHAQTFDIVRSVRGAQNDIRSLQVQNAGVVRKSLNQVAASLSLNPYFWGMDPTGWAATAGTFSIVSDPPDPAPYPYAGLYINDGSGTGALMLSDTPFPVIPSQQYLVQAYVYSSATSVQIGFDFQDSAHSPVSGPTDPTVTITANTWTLITTPQQAPATAAFAYPRVGSPSADSAQTYVTGIVTQLSTATYQLGSSPPAIETWHTFGAFGNGWTTNHGRYRLTPNGELEVDVSLSGSGTTGTITWPSFILPTAYRPTITRRIPGVPSSATCHCTINTSGAISLSIAAAAGTFDAVGQVPLD